MKNKFKSILDGLILIYIFLLPWQAVYIFDEKFINGFKSQLLTGQIFATEIILWLIIILYLVFSFQFSVFKKFPAFKLGGKKQMFILALWLFLAYSGLSIFWSADRLAEYYLWLHFLEAGALLLIILTSNASIIKLLWALLLSAGLQGLLATQQFLSQAIPANKWLGIAAHSAAVPGDIVIEVADGRWLRAYGSFSHPNILGGFLVLGLIAGLMLWLHYFRSPDKIFIAGNSARNKFAALWLKLLSVLSVSMIASAGLFFTFSRSAWLAAGLVFILFIILSMQMIRKLGSAREIFQFLLFPLGSLLLLAAFFFIFNSLILARADATNRLEAISKTERINQISESLTMIKSAPLFGTGLNNYTEKLSGFFPLRSAYQLQPVHNIYLLILSELGFIGLTLFLLLIAAALNLRLDKKNILSLSPLAACLAIGLFDHYFWTSYAGLMIFWLSLTICAKYGNLTNQDH